MLELNNVSKYYNSNFIISKALNNITLTFKENEFVAITGPSGSGKTTLINVLSGLDGFDDGFIEFGGKKYYGSDLIDLESYRKNISNVFQNYYLINSYTVFDNVFLAVDLKNGETKKDKIRKTNDIIKKVGLENLKKRKVVSLSGGEKQRVGIARAIASSPKILICDEPTGNLDSQNSKDIIELIKSISKDRLVIIVTHDYELIEDKATRIINIEDGMITSDRLIENKENRNNFSLVENNNKKKNNNNNIDSKRKITILDDFLLALKNIRKSWRKNLIIFSVFLFFSFFIALFYSFILENNNFYYYDKSSGSSFIDDSKERLVIQTKNKENIKENSRISEIIDKADYCLYSDYLLDMKFQIFKKDFNFSFNNFFININYSFRFYLPDSYKIICGRLPEKENEIMIGALDASYFQYNPEMYINNYFKLKEGEVQYKVVGMYSFNASYNNSRGNVFEIYLKNGENQELTNYAIKENANSILNSNYYLEVSESIPEKTIVGYNNLEIRYLSKKVDLSNYTFISGSETIISLDIFKEIMENYDDDLTLYFDNIKDLKKARKNILDFNVYYPNELYNVEIETRDFIIYLFLILVFIVLVFSTTMVIYWIIKPFYNSKIRDYNILRILGFSKQNVYLISAFEFSIIIILSMISFVILISELSIFNLDYISKSKLIFGVLIILILMSFLLLYKLLKLLYKYTAEGILKGDRHAKIRKY